MFIRVCSNTGDYVVLAILQMSEVKYTFTKGHYNCNHKVAKLKNICWTKHTNSILYYIHPQAVNGLNSIYAEYYKKDSLGS